MNRSERDGNDECAIVSGCNGSDSRKACSGIPGWERLPFQVAWTGQRLDEYVKDRALQETDRRDGKTIWTSSLTVLPDGMRVV
jgi:hypothetical protein